MKSGVSFLTWLGIGGAALGVFSAAVPEQHASMRFSTRGDRPGPDSARLETLFTAMLRTDPVVCEMLSDQIGNFWSSSEEYGVGRLNDDRVSARPAKDSVTGRVTDAASIRYLTTSLGTDDPCVRHTAAKMLGNSSVTDDALGRLLTHPVPRVREAALLAISEQDRPALRGRIEGVLGGANDAGVAAMAAYALGELGDRASLPSLLRAADSRPTKVRLAATWALKELEDPASVTALIALTRDTNVGIRYYAVEALGSIGHSDAVPALTKALTDISPEVRRAAAEALGDIGK